jgi:shikimate dehydrogenase
MGNPVQQSLSPIIHQLFAKQYDLKISYDAIQINPSELGREVIDFFKQGGRGLNITAPCKEQAFSMSMRVRPNGQLARSVNTLWMEDGQLCADNSDGVGLLRDLMRYTELKDRRLLLLGAGGAARGVIGPLLSTNPCQLTVANRTPERARFLQQDFPGIDTCALNDLVSSSYEVIINATSASLYDKTPTLSEHLMAQHPFCYDLAYKKSGETAFVSWAQSFKSKAVGGLGMLVEQAAESFYIWHGIRPETSLVLNYLGQK